MIAREQEITHRAHMHDRVGMENRLKLARAKGLIMFSEYCYFS